MDDRIMAEPGQEFKAIITADVEEMARRIAAALRGSAKPQGPVIVNNGTRSYRCSECGGLTHAVTVFLPSFCQRCGRLFDWTGDGDG